MRREKHLSAAAAAARCCSHRSRAAPLRGAGIPILDVASEQPDLEDVFVEMTRA